VLNVARKRFALGFQTANGFGTLREDWMLSFSFPHGVEKLQKGSQAAKTLSAACEA
jgi:hypothetical protein